MTITTPLSDTVCRRLATTSYDQAVYQVRILYIHPLSRYERWQKDRNWDDLGVRVH